MSLLNLGCGNRYHPSWTNVDLFSSDGSVIGYDLRKEIPFADETFEVVYHSHLLEHFSQAQALPFLQECHRVLKAEGIIRVVVPDLERMARTYLHALEKAAQGNRMWQHNYEWITLELYDQTVREVSGGAMAAYLRRETVPNLDFVLERIGVEGQRIIEQARQQRNRESNPVPKKPLPFCLIRQFLHLASAPSRFRERLIQFILGNEYELLQLGRFRRGGEIHHWMYDRYSLASLLRDAGFRGPEVMSPIESRIPGWADYHLDAEPDGTVYKPDSLYMEAVKP